MKSIPMLAFWMLAMDSLRGIEIPIFIRSDALSDLFPLDIPNNITASELYRQIPGVGVGDVLYIGGIEIGKLDTRHIADLSICPETVINIIRRSPSDAQALYYYAEDLKN